MTVVNEDRRTRHTLAGLLRKNADPAEIADARDRVVGFLRTAPEDLRPWADGLITDIDDDVAASQMSQVLADDELAAAHASPAAGRAAKSREPAGKRAKQAVILVLVLLVALLVYGVYRMGLTPSEEATAVGQQSAPAAEQLQADVEQLRATVAAEPDNPDARLALGVALFNQTDLAGAEEQWKKAAELAPESAEPYYNLGFLYFSTEPPRTQEAQEAWQKVIELEPDSRLAETVSSHLGHLGGAEGESAGSPAAGQNPAPAQGPAPAQAPAQGPAPAPAADGN